MSMQVNAALNGATTALDMVVAATVANASASITQLQQTALATINTALSQATALIQTAQAVAVANITSTLGAAQTALGNQLTAAQVVLRPITTLCSGYNQRVQGEIYMCSPSPASTR